LADAGVVVAARGSVVKAGAARVDTPGTVKAGSTGAVIGANCSVLGDLAKGTAD
jgi:hypothetical protein